MQIVIDISDDLKDKICNATEDWATRYVEGWNLEIARIIRNGTPLPKGHGDLIDRNALIRKQFIPNVGFELVELDDLKTAPTVIPADK